MEMDGTSASSGSSSGWGKTRSRAVAMGFPPPLRSCVVPAPEAGDDPAPGAINDRRFGATRPPEAEATTSLSLVQHALESDGSRREDQPIREQSSSGGGVRENAPRPPRGVRPPG